jgi:hypothetical protein
MRQLLGVMLGVTLAAGFLTSARAGDEAAQVTIEKAIKALGGEEKLAKAEAFTWKSKGKFTIAGVDNKFASQVTVSGLDQYRSEFEGELNGNPVKRITVLKGEKGWRKEGNQLLEMDKDQVANEKRFIYLMIVPTTLVALKSKNFAIGEASEEKVGDKPAVGIKGKGPDGKDFTIYFEKESGVPIKLVTKLTGVMGEEFTIATSFGNYKDFDGIQKATKIESSRDGEKFLDAELTEFKVIANVEASTFDQPK